MPDRTHAHDNGDGSEPDACHGDDLIGDEIASDPGPYDGPCDQLHPGDIELEKIPQRLAPLPSPDAEHPVTQRPVQINIRLRADDHARLARAAQSVGLPPTTLARALVLNGAAQVLRDSGAT